MKIDILSSAGGRSSGYLLRHDDAAVLIDCGPGTAVSLARSGWLERLDDLFAVPTLPQMAHTIRASFELAALGMDGAPAMVAPRLRLTSYPALHAVPSAALRFSSAHQTVAFSSDTGACDALIEAASNADLFLCEATYLAASAAELERHGHLTPELAAATASRAGARELVLTHLARAGDATAALTAASRHFKIACTTVALPGTTISAKPLQLPPS